jgi:hypothetical protein
MRAAPSPSQLVDAVTARQSANPRAAVREPRRRVLVLVSLALAGLVAGVTVPLVLANSSSQRQLTLTQLRQGDCLTGSNLGLGTDSPWPDTVTAVPCTQQHLAEVFFAGNDWPRSLKKYPGSNAVNSQAQNRCALAFIAYDGLPPAESIFNLDSIVPSPASDWASGDRWLVCVAYQQGVTLSHSFEGSVQ